MKLDIVRQLQRVKKLHADRAEDVQRQRQAALDAAHAGVAQARAALQAWRDDMPRKQAAIYDSILGKVVALEQVEACKARIIDLHAHEQLLESRVGEAEASVQTARAALDEATALLGKARRDLSKFDDLATTLRREAATAAEQREDAELEEAAEVSFRGGRKEDDDDWSEAA